MATLHKEKAVELRDKFRIFLGEALDGNDEPVNSYLLGKKAAKRAAILHIEETIRYFNTFMDSRRNFRHELEVEAESNLLKIKDELEKL